MKFDASTFKGELHLIKELFLSIEIQESKNYKEWYAYYVKIYGKIFTNIDLYIIYSFVYLISQLFIIKFVLNQDLNSNQIKVTPNFLKSIPKKINDRFNLNIDVEMRFFSPIINALKDLETEKYEELICYVVERVKIIETKPEYFFDEILQNLIHPHIRHKSGEFYTPPFIVKKMVEESYSLGEKVIDPCCGSGNFIIEIIKTIFFANYSKRERLEAIANIYGYDINPISIYLTKLNLLYILKENFHYLNSNFVTTDFLFQNNAEIKEKFDLVIGNPPWFTLRDIESLNYQKKIKQLSDELEIKPHPKNVLNIEIASLFFYKAKMSLLKDDAKIFFVITKGVINGSHAARFRNFQGFHNIKLWKFTKQITDIFNIDFICIYAQKLAEDRVKTNLKVPSFLYSADLNSKKLNYYDAIDLSLEKTEILVPYSTEIKGNKYYTNKLITKENQQQLIPIKTSEYKKLFHKGADLNPRNLIFFKKRNRNDSLIIINPDQRIFKRAKEPWDKVEFSNEIIEKEYMFKAIKSTELVKFYVYDFYNIFLPLKKETLGFDYYSLKTHAKKFYDKINKIYLNNKKDSTMNESLMDNLNRWSKLINTRQMSEIKVVYNNSGSVVNSAVVQGDFLITGDLSFYSTNNMNEAYYLSAILNSPLMTKQVQIKKSSRHIFKIPFEIPLKIYDENNENHRKLAELAKKAHKIAETSTLKQIRRNNYTISKNKIQSILSKDLTPILNEIDKFLTKDLKT
ncbi:MAG: N-6 DNA methylase [Candidatus Lokiarchaeota archaeon]|nr:N-6 DNA methylase [Candidatus Lokiarchaeota archaeon]